MALVTDNFNFDGSYEEARNIFGRNDENVAIIEDAFMTSVTLGDGVISVEGESAANVAHAISVLSAVFDASKSGEHITRQLVAYYCDMESLGKTRTAGQILTDAVCLNAKGAPIRPKTAGQKDYVDAISNNTVTFGIGPAGTGTVFSLPEGCASFPLFAGVLFAGVPQAQSESAIIPASTSAVNFFIILPFCPFI